MRVGKSWGGWPLPGRSRAGSSGGAGALAQTAHDPPCFRPCGLRMLGAGIQEAQSCWVSADVSKTQLWMVALDPKVVKGSMGTGVWK